MAAGEDLYHLDAGALSGLDAELVVTQDLCAVCALDAADVEAALDHLGCGGRVLTLAPTDLEGVFASVHALGAAVGASAEADALVAGLRTRLAAVAERLEGASARPTVLLEWTDPPFAPGHWVPEMVAAGGGRNMLGAAGRRSERVSWDDVARARPEVVVCAPCGLGLTESSRAAEEALAAGVLPRGTEVWAVDANASYARPGPRLVDGVEALAGILHPGRAAAPSADAARLIRA
jgi:iron complex transport system substrate-binding protein